MHERMGSTGKGIGAARSSRIMRTANRVKDEPWLVERLRTYGIRVVDVADALRQATHIDTIIIEGTQGYGLGLHAGYYPQCTSSDCRAIDFLAMAGLNPWATDVELEVWAAARMYPIRVAGNSGPMYNETTWADLGLPEELTTVTQKVRRVGHWDADLVRDAVVANGGSPTVRVALTMTDQRFAGLMGVTQRDDLLRETDVKRFIWQVENEVEADVAMVTTSDRTAVWM